MAEAWSIPRRSVLIVEERKPHGHKRKSLNGPGCDVGRTNPSAVGNHAPHDSTDNEGCPRDRSRPDNGSPKNLVGAVPLDESSPDGQEDPRQRCPDRPNHHDYSERWCGRQHNERNGVKPSCGQQHSSPSIAVNQSRSAKAGKGPGDRSHRQCHAERDFGAVVHIEHEDYEKAERPGSADVEHSDGHGPRPQHRMAPKPTSAFGQLCENLTKTQTITLRALTAGKLAEGHNRPEVAQAINDKRHPGNGREEPGTYWRPNQVVRHDLSTADLPVGAIQIITVDHGRNHGGHRRVDKDLADGDDERDGEHHPDRGDIGNHCCGQANHHERSPGLRYHDEPPPVGSINNHPTDRAEEQPRQELRRRNSSYQQR